MVNRARKRGTAWESVIVDYLQRQGWIHAERRSLNGSLDRGDVAGIPSVVIEAKNEKAINLAGWVDEAEAERRNDRAEIAVVWAKRRGRVTAGDGYVVMTGAQFVWLLDQAGYGASR